MYTTADNEANLHITDVIFRPKLTSGSAMAEEPRDALVSRNSTTIPIVWHYLRDPTFSRIYTITECDKHTDGRTDTRRWHVLR